MNILHNTQQKKISNEEYALFIQDLVELEKEYKINEKADNLGKTLFGRVLFILFINSDSENRLYWI